MCEVKLWRRRGRLANVKCSAAICVFMFVRVRARQRDDFTAKYRDSVINLIVIKPLFTVSYLDDIFHILMGYIMGYRGFLLSCVSPLYLDKVNFSLGLIHISF